MNAGTLHTVIRILRVPAVGKIFWLRYLLPPWPPGLLSALGRAMSQNSCNRNIDRGRPLFEADSQRFPSWVQPTFRSWGLLRPERRSGPQFSWLSQEWAIFSPLKNSAYLPTLCLIIFQISLLDLPCTCLDWTQAVNFLPRLKWAWGQGGNRQWRPIESNRTSWRDSLRFGPRSPSFFRLHKGGSFVVTTVEALGTSLMEEVEDPSMIAICNQ